MRPWEELPDPALKVCAHQQQQHSSSTVAINPPTAAALLQRRSSWMGHLIGLRLLPWGQPDCISIAQQGAKHVECAPPHGMPQPPCDAVSEPCSFPTTLPSTARPSGGRWTSAPACQPAWCAAPGVRGCLPPSPPCASHPASSSQQGRQQWHAPWSAWHKQVGGWAQQAVRWALSQWAEGAVRPAYPMYLAVAPTGHG